MCSICTENIEYDNCFSCQARVCDVCVLRHFQTSNLFTCYNCKALWPSRLVMESIGVEETLKTKAYKAMKKRIERNVKYDYNLINGVCECGEVVFNRKCVRDRNHTSFLPDTKPCPGCKVTIAKDGGCNNMFCKSCCTTFEWTTGEIRLNEVDETDSAILRELLKYSRKEFHLFAWTGLETILTLRYRMPATHEANAILKYVSREISNLAMVIESSILAMDEPKVLIDQRRVVSARLRPFGVDITPKWKVNLTT